MVPKIGKRHKSSIIVTRPCSLVHAHPFYTLQLFRIIDSTGLVDFAVAEFQFRPAKMDDLFNSRKLVD